MTLAEIRKRHQGKWVLIEYRELDRDLEVVNGTVIAEASTKEDIYRLQMAAGPGRKLAIEYCGDWPTDVAVMFWLVRANRSISAGRVTPLAAVAPAPGASSREAGSPP